MYLFTLIGISCGEGMGNHNSNYSSNSNSNQSYANVLSKAISTTSDKITSTLSSLTALDPSGYQQSYANGNSNDKNSIGSMSQVIDNISGSISKIYTNKKNTTEPNISSYTHCNQSNQYNQSNHILSNNISYENSQSFHLVSNIPVINGSNSSSHGTTGSSATDGNYEKQMLESLCDSGGLKNAINDEKLKSFLLIAPTLNPEIIGTCLIELLHNDSWQTRYKALVVITNLSESVHLTNHYNWWKNHTQEVERLIYDSKNSIKTQAKKAHSLLVNNNSNINESDNNNNNDAGNININNNVSSNMSSQQRLNEIIQPETTNCYTATTMTAATNTNLLDFDDIVVNDPIISYQNNNNNNNNNNNQLNNWSVSSSSILIPNNTTTTNNSTNNTTNNTNSNTTDNTNNKNNTTTNSNNNNNNTMAMEPIHAIFIGMTLNDQFISKNSVDNNALDFRLLDINNNSSNNSHYTPLSISQLTTPSSVDNNVMIKDNSNLKSYDIFAPNNIITQFDNRIPDMINNNNTSSSTTVNQKYNENLTMMTGNDSMNKRDVKHTGKFHVNILVAKLVLYKVTVYNYISYYTIFNIIYRYWILISSCAKYFLKQARFLPIYY